MAISKSYDIETVKIWQSGQGDSVCGATARVQELASTDPQLSIRIDGMRLTLSLLDLQEILEDAGVWPKQAASSNLREAVNP